MLQAGIAIDGGDPSHFREKLEQHIKDILDRKRTEGEDVEYWQHEVWKPIHKATDRSNVFRVSDLREALPSEKALTSATKV